MISKRLYVADGSTSRFLSDFIIRSVQFARPYVYIFDNTLPVDGTGDILQDITKPWSYPDNLYRRGVDAPASVDLVTVDKWNVVDNSILFYTTPLAGTSVWVEVASSVEEFGNTLTAPSVERAETAATNAALSESNAKTSETNAKTSETNAANSAASVDSSTIIHTIGSGLANAGYTKIEIDDKIVNTIDTIADLKALATPLDKVWVSGYYTKGDGAFGSHIFEWDATSTDADNGGTIIKLTNVATGRYKLRYDDAVNVKWFGAKGDGVTNDALAFQETIDYALSLNQSSIYIPADKFNITTSILISPSGTGELHINLSIYGDGKSSILYHNGDFPLFSFTGLIHEFNANNFNVYSKTLKTLSSSALFYFPDGNSESYYENIYYGVEKSEVTYPAQFYYCGTDKYNDTVSFLNCVVSGVTAGGYHIGKGSSVWISGGRVVGTYPSYSPVGLNLSGGNGGVFVWSTDFILLQTCINITKDSGVSNREIFLNPGIMDSSNIGLNVTDESYVTCTSIWCASADEANINYTPSTNSSNAFLNVTGGTVFNAGSSGRTGSAAGMKYNGKGRFQLNNVVFRNNDGRAFEIFGVNATYKSSFSNCEFIDNAEDAAKATDILYIGGKIDFKNCAIQGSVTTVTFDATSRQDLGILDCTGFPNIVTPSLPPSDVQASNDTGYYVDVYLRQGTVNSIWVNGNPVYDLGTGASANHHIRLAPRDTYKIVYSVAPNQLWLKGF